MINLKELIDCCKAESISLLLSPTEESVWRSFARQYSQKFHTSLHLVLKMDPEFVITHVLESQLENVDVEENLEDLMERVYIIEDPSYEAKKEDDLQDFIKKANAEEELRIKEGRPVGKVSKNETSLKTLGKEKPRKGGFLNTAYLAKQDTEG